jgi:outer membrane protein assembly factor BamA
VKDGPFVEIYARRRDFPQEDFFGLGPDSREEDRSNYAIRDTFVRATGGFRAGRTFSAGVNVGYLDPVLGAGTDTRMPSTTDLFDPSTLPGFSGLPAFTTFEPWVELKTIDRPYNEMSGGWYRFSFSRYNDRDLDAFSFNRWDVDLRQYFAFFEGSRTIALRAVASSAEADTGHQIPFYLQPTLGGAQTLRGYRSFRFRDESALLLQAEYRWRINELIAGALFYDTGAVARRLGDIGRLERNYGIGMRVGGRNGVTFRTDLAFGGSDGMLLLMRFDDVF